MGVQIVILKAVEIDALLTSACCPGYA